MHQVRSTLAIALIALSGCSGTLAFSSGGTYYRAPLTDGNSCRVDGVTPLETVPADWVSVGAIAPNGFYTAVVRNHRAAVPDRTLGEFSLTVYDPVGDVVVQHDMASTLGLVQAQVGPPLDAVDTLEHLFVRERGSGWVSDHELAVFVTPRAKPSIELRPLDFQFVLDVRTNSVTRVEFLRSFGDPLPIPVPRPSSRVTVDAGVLTVDGCAVQGVPTPVDWADGAF